MVASIIACSAALSLDRNMVASAVTSVNLFLVLKDSPSSSTSDNSTVMNFIRSLMNSLVLRATSFWSSTAIASCWKINSLIIALFFSITFPSSVIANASPSLLIASTPMLFCRSVTTSSNGKRLTIKSRSTDLLLNLDVL